MPRLHSNDLDLQGRALVERLHGRWTPGRGGLCRCPAHDDRRPSLSVRIGRTSLLLHCFAGCDIAHVLRAVAELGHALTASAARRSDPIDSDAGSSGLLAGALRLWCEARPIAGTPAARYLAQRGLATTSSELRYHPRAPHGPRPFTCFRPALIAAVRDGGGVVAVHRTFLEPGSARLAPIDTPRMGLGRFGSGAVRLAGAAARLGLAEGLETALSAMTLFGFPCWATLGTERFAHVEVPAQVKALVLFADNDAGGRRAERLARSRFPHMAIEARYPPRSGADWNDVLRELPRAVEIDRSERDCP